MRSVPTRFSPTRPAGLDRALHLVEREWGAALADAVADGMEYERTGDVYGA